MQTWQMAAEALFSGLLLSNTPPFEDEQAWVMTGIRPKTDFPRIPPSDAARTSVLAAAIRAVAGEREAKGLPSATDGEKDKGEPIMSGGPTTSGVVVDYGEPAAMGGPSTTDGAAAGRTPFLWDEFLVRVWNCEGNLRTRVAQLDSFLDRYVIDELTSCFIFDVCYTHWLSAESALGELSEAWLADEEMIADRGSELLTVLMYLQEVAASGLEPDLNDFVDAFLTDEDFDLQDDLGVFEVLIQQSDTLQYPYPRLIRESSAAATGTPLEGMLAGLLCFFKEPSDPSAGLGSVFGARLSDAHALPVFMCLAAASKSAWCFPKHLRPNLVQSHFFGMQ